MSSIAKMNVKELKAECKRLGIKGYSKWKKAALISNIQEYVQVKPKTPTPHRQTTPPLPSNLETSPLTPTPSPENDDILDDSN